MADYIQPEEMRTVTPYFIVKDVEKLLGFITDVMNGREKFRSTDDAGLIRHAEAIIGDSLIMIGGANKEWKSIPGSLYVMVDDVDQTYAHGVKAGATSLMEPSDQEYGHRIAVFKDETEITWWLASEIKK